MSKNTLFISLVAASLALSGCSSTLKVANLNSAGKFDSNAHVKAEDIKIIAPFDKAKYGGLVVVLPFTENNQINDFYFQSIKNSGKFGTVLDKAGVERLVIDKNITDVTDATSILSLRKLSNTIGPFLVVKPYFEYKGGYNFQASIEAVDATTGSTVFRAQKGAFNWGGLDKPLFYPLFNAFVDWVDGVPPKADAPAK